MSTVDKTLKIRETMQRIQYVSGDKPSRTHVIFSEPKSKSSIRDIPLPDFLCRIIRSFQGMPEAYILTGSAERYAEPRTMQYHFKKYIRQCGIADANFHACRHTFATRCVEVGFELKSLSEILGHASVNITLDRYVHSSFALKSANMNKLLFPVKLPTSR